MPTTAYLFLDFDGTRHGERRDTVEFERAALLDRWLAHHPHVRIVLSTAWRFSLDLDDLIRCLPPTIAARCIDTLPRDDRDFTPAGRGVLMREWMARHATPAASFAALDDAPDLFAADDPLVACDPSLGLTPANLEALARRLADPGRDLKPHAMAPSGHHPDSTEGRRT